MSYVSGRKILKNSYVPNRAKFYYKNDKGDLDTPFKQADHDEIISNSDEVTITNFDLIHQQWRGDQPLHDRKYYETLFKKKVEHELNNRLNSGIFLSSAQRCKRKTFTLKKTNLTNLLLTKN